MGKMKSRIGAGVLVAVMVCTVAPITAFAQSAEELWVNGVDILTAPANTVSCGDGTAVYDVDSKKLTLTNATIYTGTDSVSANDGTTGIFTQESLSLVLVGQNIIGDENNSTINNGIISSEDLEITGPGTLKVNVKKTADNRFDYGIYANSVDMSDTNVSVQLTAESNYENFSVGIYSASSSTIENTVLEVAGFQSGISSDLFTGHSAIEISGSKSDVTLSSFGSPYNCISFQDITVKGAAVKMDTQDSSSGFRAENIIAISEGAAISVNSEGFSFYSKNGITVEDSTIQAASSGVPMMKTQGAISLINATVNETDAADDIVAQGDIVISGGTIFAQGDSDAISSDAGKISINGGANVTAKGERRGLAAKGDITIDSSTVHASSPDNSYGYGTIYTDGALSISGSTSDVTAEGFRYGIESKSDITFSGGKIEVTGKDEAGITAAGTLSISDTADITAQGYYFGLISKGNMSISGGTVEAFSTADDAGIVTTAQLNITGGKIHAKGAEGYGAISAVSKGNAGQPQIFLENVKEMNGGHVAVTNNPGDTARNFTSLISKNETTLTNNGGNALNEVWLAVPYTVTFDVNGGSGTNSTVEVYSGNKVTAPAATPAKDGSHFSGWYLDDTKFDFANTAITGDITLKAKLDAHTPNADDGDCTTAITCSVCAAVTTAAKTHDWETSWKSDSSNHWNNCKNAGCTQLGNKTSHTFGEWVVGTAATETTAGNKHRDCGACNYKEAVTIPVAPHTHTPSSEWSKDAKTHWHNCTANDGERMNTAVHTPGAAATAERPQVCTVCGYEIAPKLQPKKVIVDNNTGTKAEYEGGSVFDADIVLSVTSKPQAEMDKSKDNVEKVAPGLVLGGLYDVKLLKDGVAIQPNGKIKVSIPLTDAMKSMTNLQIIYIDDNGNVTMIPSEVKDGIITFVTDHFSDYGVIGKAKAADSGNNSGSNNTSSGSTNSPQTGDNSPMLLFVLMMCASATALVILRKKKKVFKH